MTLQSGRLSLYSRFIDSFYHSFPQLNMTQIESPTDAAAVIQHAIEGYNPQLKDINRKVLIQLNYAVAKPTGIIS